MPGAAQTSAMRQSLNDRAYNMHMGQGTTERCRQEEDQAPVHWDCNSPLTEEDFGGTCLNAKKVYNRYWYNEHFGGVHEFLNNEEEMIWG